MKPESIDLEWIYGSNIIRDDLDEESIKYLEENDPDRLAEIDSNTQDYYREFMFPDGEDE